MSDEMKSTGKAARVMIVDDHPTVCEGLGHRISSQDDMITCGAAGDVDDALKKIPDFRPDVLIIDIALKHSDGLDLIRELKARHKRIRALVHSMYDEAVYADRCLRSGAMGYINKEADPDEVVHAIREVLAGRVYLSPAMTNEVLGRTFQENRYVDPLETLTNRQLEVFRLIGEGHSAQQIASRLHISIHTVETHRENIKRKLKLDSISTLNRRAILWAEQNR